MPNRIIKESICTSDNLNNLSLEEEVFFYRLLVHCDDYGLMDARPAILRAKCFPLKVDKIKLSQIEKWLHSLVKNQLIALYEYDGRPYLKMLSWEEHQQLRSRKAKYPLPPEDIPCKREHIMPEEKDIEDLLYDVMSSTKRFEEHTLLSVERQVRVGESYLDIVAKTESSETLVFELKRGRLSNKAIDQISKYLTLINGNGILIGCGLSANFDIERCRSNDIAVVIYDDDLNMSLVLGNSAVNSIDLTLNHVKSRYVKLAPNPIQSNPIQSESNPNTNPSNICANKSHRFTPPTLEEVAEYCRERNNGIDPQRFIDFYSAKGWMIGKNKMKDWKAAVRTWEKSNDFGNGRSKSSNPFLELAKEEGLL